MTEVDAVDYLINTSNGLYDIYDFYKVYQDYLFAIQHNNYNLLKIVLNFKLNNNSPYLFTSTNTLKNLTINF